MLSQRKLEERNDELALRLSEEMPICITNERFARLTYMTLNTINNCNHIINILSSFLSEPEPDFNAIRCSIDSCMSAIKALSNMHFIEVLSSRDISHSSVYDFLKLRNDILYDEYFSLELLRDNIPLNEKNDEIVVKYRTERKYSIDSRADICLIFDQNMPDAERAIKSVLSTSDISFLVKKVMAEPFCCPNSNWDDTTNNYLYDIYTIVIVSFWNPVKQEEVSSLFPDAFFPESEKLREYYNKYFLFESLFRDLPSYEDIASPS